jgi:hypothetical protein
VPPESRQPGDACSRPLYTCLGRQVLVPAVVPEFRHITVGGGISGLAGESSSFRYASAPRSPKRTLLNPYLQWV